jgi:glycosyltransferase involved in cell wall biosynthesis
MEKLAIIIPTLNEENNLPNLLRILSEQNYGQKEVIVVDDGSKDQTISIAKNQGCQILKRMDDRNGPSFRRNQGARYTKAEVVCFLDADTGGLSQGFFKQAMDYFQDPKVVAVNSGVAVIKDSLIEKILYLGIKFPILSHSPIFFRRSDFLAIGGYPEIGYSEDWVLFFKLQDYIHSTKKIIVNDPKVVFYKHDPHQLKGLIKQRIWYGKTFIPLLKQKKFFNFGPLKLTLVWISIIGVVIAIIFFSFLWALIIAVPLIFYFFQILGDTIKNKSGLAFLRGGLNLILALVFYWGIIQYLFFDQSIGNRLK